MYDAGPNLVTLSARTFGNDPYRAIAALKTEIARLRAQLAEAGIETERRADQAVVDLAAARAAHAGLEADRAGLAPGEARLSAILESAPDVAILTTDPAGRITSWNRGAENVLGWPSDEVLGGDARVILNSEDRAAGAAEAEMGTALRDGRAEDVRWHL